MTDTESLIDGAIQALEDAKTADGDQLSHHLWKAVHHIRAAGATDLANNHDIRGRAARRLVEGDPP